MNSDEARKIPLIYPDWPAPPNVRAVCTTRQGGVSIPPWDSLNLGSHVGDTQGHVQENRARLAEACQLPVDAFGWLNQVHGTNVVRLHGPHGATLPDADASFTSLPQKACTILTADCLPVILCDYDGTTVAAAHAGWRSLSAGVLEKLVACMHLPGSDLMAWLGPAIGPTAFEVGPEVKAAFSAWDPRAATAFCSTGARPGHYLADIYLLARLRLEALGVRSLHGGGFCTVSDHRRFYSYRRDGQTGRMTTVIWKN